MSDAEFIPMNTLKRFLTHWYIIFILGVLGGILGWAFHFFQAPVYEATAALTVTMDFTDSELSQYEQDYAFNAIGAVITSDAVRDQVIAEAKLDGISISPAQLGQEMFLEGKQSDWELHIRDQDPQVAADIANIWAQVANDVLANALEHAMQAEQLQVQIDSLEACLPAPVDQDGSPTNIQPAPTECGRYSLMEIGTELENWTTELVQQKALTLGVLPSFEFAITSHASSPSKPVLSEKASLTLAGAMIGFIISLWVTGSLKVHGRD